MSDLIKRQETIDAVVNREMVTTRGTEYLNGYVKCQRDILDIIERLPSAQPEIIRCKDCSFDRDCTHTMTRESRGGGIIYCPVEYCSEAERKDNG